MTAYDFQSRNNRRIILLLGCFLLVVLAAVYGLAYIYGCYHYSRLNRGESVIDVTASVMTKMVTSALDKVSAPAAGKFNEDNDEPEYAFWEVHDTKSLAVAFAGRAVLVALLLSILWFNVLYRFCCVMALNAAHAVRLKEEQHRELYRLAGTMCIAAGLPAVKLYVISDSNLNAFAVGTTDDTRSIVVTQGLLDKLSHTELEAVLAQEVAHLAMGDTKLAMAGLGSAMLFSFLATLSLGGVFTKGKGNIFTVIFGVVFGVVCFAVSWFMVPLMRLAVSRSCEYRADAYAVLLNRNPEALIGALEKIKEHSEISLLENHPTMAALCIAFPRKEVPFLWVFSGLWQTHPPIEKRIAALREMNGEY